MYCYLEFKPCSLINLKLFSVRVKELCEPIVLQKKKKKKKKLTVFTLFKRILLRKRSLSNARQFYGKKAKLGRKICILTENWLSRNEILCAAGNHNYMSHMCAKGFLDSNFN